MSHRLAAFALLILATSSLRGQQAIPDSLPASLEVVPETGVPEKAWIDLRQNAPSSATQSAPRWVEAVAMVPEKVVDGVPKSIFRIRVAKPVGDYSVLFFRLFFEDKADAQPELLAWDESGTQVL